MVNFGDDDLDVFFGEFAVPIIYAGQTVLGIVDSYDARESGYGLEMVDRIKTVSVPYNAFATPLVREAAITVDGVAMVIKTPELMRDGAIITFSVVLP